MGDRRKYIGWAQDGGKTVSIGGATSSNSFQRSYPSATVTVYLTGTTDLATLYSDRIGTSESNPLTAGSDGKWEFYCDERVDVRLSGGGIDTPFTLGDMPANRSSPFIEAASLGTLGTANDTAVFQRAIDKATAEGGGTVLIPAGTFIHRGLSLDTNVSIVGVGKSSVLKFDAQDTLGGWGIDTADGTGIGTTYPDTDDPPIGMSMASSAITSHGNGFIGIDDADASGFSVGDWLFIFEGTPNDFIPSEMAFIHTIGSAGSGATGVTKITLSNRLTYAYTAAGSIRTYARWDDNVIRDLTFDATNVPAATGSYVGAVHLGGARNFLIENCHFTDNYHHAISIETGGSGGVIRDNYIEGMCDAIELNKYVSNVLVEGNKVIYRSRVTPTDSIEGRTGISLSDVQFSTIIGNFVHISSDSVSDTYGIGVNLSYYVNAVDNVVVGGNNGIALVNSMGCRLEGNRVENASDQGISLNNSHEKVINLDRNTVSRNTVEGPGDRGIHLSNSKSDGSNMSLDNVISSNIIRDSGSQGITIVEALRTEVTDNVIIAPVDDGINLTNAKSTFISGGHIKNYTNSGILTVAGTHKSDNVWIKGVEIDGGEDATGSSIDDNIGGDEWIIESCILKGNDVNGIKMHTNSDDWIVRNNTLTGNISADFSVEGTGHIFQNNIFDDSDAFKIVAVADATLRLVSDVHEISAATAVSLNGTTAFNNGARIWQQVILTGTDDTKTITVNDGANTQLGASTRVLGLNDTLTLVWNGTDWLEVSFVNN
jgi:parallel beta-helix repeat protein